MNFLSPKKEYFLTLAVGIICVYQLLAILIPAWGFTTDDAYISWVYARQLANNHGLLWHVELPRVEGYSNFLWVIIASIVIKLQLPLVVTIKLISCSSLGAGVFSLYRLGRLFFTPLLSILPVFIFSHYIGVAWWTISGMESMFYCALSLLLMWQCAVAFGFRTVEENQFSQEATLSTRAWIITNVVLFLLCLTRFEGLIWIVPLVFFSCCHLNHFGIKTLFTSSRALGVWILITLFCFILPYSLYFFWRVYYFGHWIPNSFSCKALVTGQLFVVDIEYIWVIFPLFIASLPYFLSTKDCRHWLLWLPSLLYLVLLWKADPLITYFGRLFLGPLALFSLSSVLGVKCFIGYFNHHLFDPKISITGIIILLTCFFVPGNDPLYLQAVIKQYQGRTQNRLIIANILNTQATTGAAVLMGDCGIVPFTARDDIRFIDTDCLNNPELTHAPYLHNLKLYADHIAAQIKPEWVIINHEPQKQGNYLFELLKKKDFFEHYELIINLESGWVYGKDAKKIDYIYKVYKRRKE